MASGIRFQVTKDRTPAIAAALPEAAGVIVRRHLGNIRDNCQRRSRVDTGAMRDGWQMRMTSRTEGEVYNDVPHTGFNEYGTRNMPAQPMLRPSIEQEREPFYDDMRGLERLVA